MEREVAPNLSVGADYVFADTVNGHRRTNRNLTPPVGVDDVGREFERIQQQVIGGNIGIVHFCSNFCDRVELAAAILRRL